LSLHFFNGRERGAFWVVEKAPPLKKRVQKYIYIVEKPHANCTNKHEGSRI